MSRVFITGSSDGLGLMAGRLLAADGHSVTLHARSKSRADDTRAAVNAPDGGHALVVGVDGSGSTSWGRTARRRSGRSARPVS